MISGTQTKKRKRKNAHGFLKRKKTKKGISILQKRRRKGRKILSA